MISIAGQPLGSPAAVTAWLRDALAAGPAHRDERSPAERLRPALEVASSGERDAILVGLVEALDEADDSLREHLIYSLRGFDSEPLRDALAGVLEPPLATWLGHTTPGGGALASVLFHVLTHGPGVEDERLILGLHLLAQRHALMDRALPHFVTFHARDHGFRLLSAHLDDEGELDPGLARRFGARFRRDAPEHLMPLARQLTSYPRQVREAFHAGAARKLSEADADALRQALDLRAG